MNALVWSALEVFFRQGLQFFVSIALARLLVPEDFGVVAILYLFVGIANAFIDGGLSGALIQRKAVTDLDQTTVFWTSLFVAIVFAAVFALAAPFIASHFEHAVLESLTYLMSVNLILSSLLAVPTAMLTKALDFKSLAKANTLATLVSGAIAVYLALQGAGVYAIMLQSLIATVVTVVVLFFVYPWRPQFAFSIESFRKLFGFGGYTLAASLIDVVYNRAYTLLIGKLFGVRELGFYVRADSTKQLPVGIVTGIVARVAFPLLSSVAGDRIVLRRGARSMLRMTMFANAPMMLGMAAVAGPLVVALFGSKWSPAVPILQVLCLAGLLWPLHVVNMNVLTAQGHAKLFLRIEVIKKAIGFALLGFGVAYGPIGVAWSQVAFGVVALFINAHYSKVFVDYSLTQQLADSFGGVFAALAMACIVFACGWYMSAPSWIELIAQVSIGVVAYFALCKAFRLQAFDEAMASAQALWARRAKRS
jgi:teichuronic acid exporter